MISGVDGNPIGSMEDLAARIGKLSAGSVVRLAVRRGPERLELQVTLGS